MAFKIKDLMINVAPSGTPEDTACCVGKQTNLIYCRGKHTDWDCTGKHSNPGVAPCSGKKSNYARLAPTGDPVEDLNELNALKAELEAALAEVDEVIEEVEESLRPKTVEEVDDLQAKLQDALVELEKIKSAIAKK